MVNPFYKNHGPVKITEIQKILRLDDFKLSTDQDISDVKDLVMAKKNEITFLNSKKYENVAKNTNKEPLVKPQPPPKQNKPK